MRNCVNYEQWASLSEPLIETSRNYVLFGKNLKFLVVFIEAHSTIFEFVFRHFRTTQFNVNLQNFFPNFEKILNFFLIKPTPKVKFFFEKIDVLPRYPKNQKYILFFSLKNTKKWKVKVTGIFS